jgi:hypothetical protein
MAFNLGRVTDCEGRLQRDFVEFVRLWSAVREDWLDERCRRFEQEHLSSLGPSMNRFTAALHEFSDSVRKADLALKDDQGASEELE